VDREDEVERAKMYVKGHGDGQCEMRARRRQEHDNLKVLERAQNCYEIAESESTVRFILFPRHLEAPGLF
jgi:hypothetical protein